MSKMKFGIVATGGIAVVIANALGKSTTSTLTAVSSRQLASAEKFVANYPGVAPVQGVPDLLARPDVDAVYIATPTCAKEEIALAAIAAGKHVLVEKPFACQVSVRRMVDAAAAKGVVFLDATHFVHHPRTALIQKASAEKIGTPRSLHTAFYFPITDRSNIRFDDKLEPMTALGDLGWYCMRAIVEYLRPTGKIIHALTVPERDPESRAILRASGLLAFASGEVSTYDTGYTSGTVLMDLQLLGDKGVIEMDDYVLDWHESAAFKKQNVPSGYTHRTGLASRADFTFISTPSELAGEVAMVDTLATLAASNDHSRRAAFANATLKTQEYLDAAWAGLTH